MPHNVTYEFPELLERDYGEPVGGQQCSETAPNSGIFTRQWTGATVTMDCSTWTPTIKMKSDDEVVEPSVARRNFSSGSSVELPGLSALPGKSDDARKGSLPPDVDPSEQLQSDLNAAIAFGSSSFAISPGIYRPKRDLLLNNARDMRIAPGGGGSVVFLFTCNWGLVLRSCMNVSVSDVTIDYDPPCYSQGIVTGSSNSSFTYTLDQGFPAPIGESAVSDARFAQAPIVKCIRWNPTTQLKMNLLKLDYNISQRHIKHLGGRSYELGVEGNAEIYKTGEIVTVGPRAGHTVLLTNSSLCTIEGLTIHGSSDMVLVEYGGGGAHTWRGNRVVRNTTKRPMGMLVSNADIFQSSGCERGPLVESNELTFAGDDCMNIHNYFSVVLKQDIAYPKRVLLLDGVGAHDIVGDSHYADAYEGWHQQLNTFSQVKIGDIARVYDQKHLGLHLTTTVLAVEESTEEQDLVLANQTLAEMGFETNTRAWVGQVRTYWVVLQEEIPTAVLLRAFINVDRLSSGGAIVRGNTMTDCGALHFKSIGGVIEKNFMNHTGGIGILIWPGWLEGSVGLRDVLVAGNSFAPNAAQAVIVGKGTSNITVIPVKSDDLKSDDPDAALARARTTPSVRAAQLPTEDQLDALGDILTS